VEQAAANARFAGERRARRLLVGLAMTLLAGVVGSTWFAVAARRAENRALTEADAKDMARQEAITSEAKAKSERDRANRERDIALAVRNFLLDDLLRQASPLTQAAAVSRSGASSADVKHNPTVLELLDRAALELSAENLNRRFPNQPLLQMEILETVGETYAAVGAHAKAIPLLMRALDLHIRHFGPVHRATIVSRVNLMNAYFLAGRMDDAAGELIRILEPIEAKLAGRGVPDDAAELAEALALCDAILDAADKIGSRQPGFTAVEVDLRQMPTALVQIARATALLRSMLHAIETRVGPDHLHAHAIRFAFGFISEGFGQTAEALRAYEQGLRVVEERLRADHPWKYFPRANVARLHERLGNFPQAIAQRERLLRDVTKRYGPDHPRTVVNMHNLARTYWDAHMLAKALPLMEETVGLMKTKWGIGHRATLDAMSDLASAYLEAGKPAAALSLMEEVCQIAMAQWGISDVRTRRGILRLVQAQTDAGRPAEAAKWRMTLLRGAIETDYTWPLLWGRPVW
jgi:tetratricopeptide (TPR) repeat protein